MRSSSLAASPAFRDSAPPPSPRPHPSPLWPPTISSRPPSHKRSRLTRVAVKRRRGILRGGIRRRSASSPPPCLTPRQHPVRGEEERVNGSRPCSGVV